MTSRIDRNDFGHVHAQLEASLADLRLDDAVNPEWRPTFVLRGLKRLPASW